MDEPNYQSLHATLTSTLAFVEDGITIALDEVAKPENAHRFVLTIPNDIDEPFVFGFKYPDQFTVGQQFSRGFRLQRLNDLKDVRVLASFELALREAEYASKVTGYPLHRIRAESVANWFGRALENRRKVKKYIEEALAKIGPQ